MAWRVEIDSAAERDLVQLDPQMARRILAFLHGELRVFVDGAVLVV